MGQYYTVYTRTQEGKEEVFPIELRYQGEKPEFFGTDETFFVGLKLMEHSYMDNPFVEQFMIWLLHHEPVHIVWVGDYAEPEECERLGFSDERVFGDESPESYLYYKGIEDLTRCNYLINYTKNLYIDLKKYIKNATYGNTYKICVFPLSLLTALGNGRGGGDYYEDYVCSDAVGSWAGDLIAIREHQPELMTEEEIIFMEKTGYVDEDDEEDEEKFETMETESVAHDEKYLRSLSLEELQILSNQLQQLTSGSACVESINSYIDRINRILDEKTNGAC